MANKPIKKISVNKERFMEVLHQHDCSILKLGEASDQIGRNEKTIRRCLNDGKMPPYLLYRIAKYLNVAPDYLAGKWDDEAYKMILDSPYEILLHMTDQQAADILKRLVAQTRTPRANGKSYTRAAIEMALGKAIEALEERGHSQK